MDQRTRKLMTMHKALHPWEDVNRLYVSRKEGGRGFATESIGASIQQLEDDIEKHEREQITVIRNDTHKMIDDRITKTREKIIIINKKRVSAKLSTFLSRRTTE